MKNQKISLIIPAYNEEKYLPRCLESVLAFAADKFDEIIVVDNASTDNTAAIAARFPGVRVVSETRKGLTYARQAGYTESTGDILVYIDADTLIYKRWFSMIEKTFTNDACVCLSGPYIFYEVSQFRQFLTLIYWTMFALPMYWVIGYMVVGGNFAIRRKTLDQMGGFDTSITFYGEDTDIARRAHAFGKVMFRRRFYIYSSARRLQKEGWITMALKYGKNFFAEVTTGKPATTNYDDIR